MPTDWEETRLLGGEIGAYAIVARRERGGNDGFIGAITNEQNRDLEVALSFLPTGVPYTAEVYRDAADAHWEMNPFAHEIARTRVTRDTQLSLHLAAGGGQTIRLKAVEAQD